MDTYQEETSLSLSSQEATYCQFTFSPMLEAHLKEKQNLGLFLRKKTGIGCSLFIVNWKILQGK